MKIILPAILFFALCLSPVLAETAPPAVEPPSTENLPLADLAKGFTQLTGSAISPLLAVSVVGAWKFWYTPEAQRAQLPWFCRPYVWGTGICLLGLCFLKDFLGTAAPPLVKKPLDVAELFESKLSALVACSAFVPFIVSRMGRQAPLETSFLLGPDARFSSFLAVATFDVRLLIIPLAIAVFFTVWLACHAINVLIALCPFGFVDAILKLFKASLLGAVIVPSLFNPYYGAVVALVILFIAVRLAPWAFRLTVFGTLFGLDVLWPRRGRRLVRPGEPHAFLARKLANAPVRTYGRLTRAEDGSVAFTYRPWLLLPDRSVTIPPGNVAIAKGILFPSLLQSFDQQRKRIIIMFLPRYRSHEQAIASHFEIGDIQDSTLIKGFKAVRAWFADTVNFGRTKFEHVRRQVAEGGVAPP